MERTKIAQIFADREAFGGKEVAVSGWARTIRDMKTFGFIELNDGSCFKNLQVVMDAAALENYKEIAGQNVGAALSVTGTVVLTPEAKQPLEIKAAAKWLTGKMVMSSAVAERIWATTLMKMPMELSTLPQVSARGPYSRETICSKVEHPLCRKGAA